MKYGKNTKQAIAFTIILTVFMIYGTILTGAYAACTIANNNTLIDIQSQNSYNIAESGSFQVDKKQKMTLTITSNIKGGTVDLFLFAPNGKEHRIIIGSNNFTKKVNVTKGLWAYNCTGIFKDGGKVHIKGTIVGVKAKGETEDKTNNSSAINTTKEKVKLMKYNTLIDIQSQNSYNIAESGSFQVEKNQKMTLVITSNIKGGTVDLFLFAPNGKEQRITIRSRNFKKKIKITKGLWTYNCSGIFKNGGKIHIRGTMKN